MPLYVPFPTQPVLSAGEWMRAVRAAYGYSHCDIARFMGVEPKLVRRWERQGRLPRKNKYRRIWNTYARCADLPELAFQFAPIEDG